MDCPFCAEPLAPQDLDRAWLASCPSCRGIFFDYRRLLELGDDVPRLEDRLAGLLAAAPVERPRPDRVTCPKCRTRMRRRTYCHRAPFELEECFGCSSVWFDPGQLGALRRNFTDEADRVAAVQALVENVSAQFDDTPAGGGSLVQSRPQQARVKLRLDLLDRLTRLVSPPEPA